MSGSAQERDRLEPVPGKPPGPTKFLSLCFYETLFFQNRAFWGVYMCGHYRRRVVAGYEYNVATCGPIVGAWAGSNQLTSPRVAPLNVTIKPLVIGLQEVTMAELARRKLRVSQNVKRSLCKKP